MHIIDKEIPMIELKNINKRFNDVVALTDVTFSVKSGEAISVVGPSGSGKSTLLRIIAGLEEPDSGAYFLDDINQVTKEKKKPSKEKIGFIFQESFLFDHLSVMDNLTLAPKLLKRASNGEVERKAYELLELVNVLEKRLAYPSELSGGQKQRVAIARALMLDPEIILFDEPTSALDVDAIDALIEVIGELKIRKKTILIVTHDVVFAQKCTNRLLFMEKSSIILDKNLSDLQESIDKRAWEFLAKR